jgi:hypothetical protein
VTTDASLAAVLAALPFRDVGLDDRLCDAFAGRVTGAALVLDDAHGCYFAVVRLVPPPGVPRQRLYVGARGVGFDRRPADRPPSPPPTPPEPDGDDAA